MIYIHIPFCKQRCIYCDFHSGVNTELKSRYVDVLCKEIVNRKDYISSDVQTIYLGGGTPSLLCELELNKIFKAISQHYDLKNIQEVTIECNPDDIDDRFLSALKSTPINRISIGIQSFCDDELKWLNRRHTSQQAIDTVRKCRNFGFNNISIDLMFSLPVQTIESWKSTLDIAMSLDVDHISCYSLMYEERSRLTKLYNDGKIEQLDETISEQMFDILVDYTSKHEFIQYEISNFSKPNKESKHNSAYWRHTPYLGVGAGAHSFNGISRQENIPNTLNYISAVEEGREDYYTIEDIDTNTCYNELIFTSLRTKQGLCLDDIISKFGNKHLDYTLEIANRFIDQDLMKISKNYLSLTKKGIYISDSIMSDFMIVD